MRRIALGLLAASLLLCGCSVAEYSTKIRVVAVMEGWEKGGTSSDGHMQEAVSMWWNGTKFIGDDVELSRASKAFDQWRREKKLFKEIESWEITSIEAVEGVYGLVVGVTIDGEAYRMRVEDPEPIEWID